MVERHRFLDCEGEYVLADDYDRLAAEVERLKGLVLSLDADVIQERSDLNNMAAENAALREKLAVAEARVDALMDSAEAEGGMAARLDEAEAKLAAAKADADRLAEALRQCCSDDGALVDEIWPREDQRNVLIEAPKWTVGMHRDIAAALAAHEAGKVER